MTIARPIFDPTLIVKRLKVTRGANVAYDEAFHQGVNVLIGENSSGKSTILNFIYYALGGDLRAWSDKALLCDDVWLEVSLNGKLATLRREISETAQSAMSIFGGPLKLADLAPSSDWIRYPYSRSKNKESFSQALFRLLNIPEATTDDTGTITVHQLLRLVYADQLSPVEDLFKSDSFDRRDVREAVGSLVIGAYSNEIYGARQKIRGEEASLKDATSELRSLRAILNSTDQEVVSTEWALAARKKLETQRENLLRQISNTETNPNAESGDDELTIAAQTEASKRVQILQAQIAKDEKTLAALQFSISDSEQYIGSLESRLTELQEARDVSEHIESILFSACPACYVPISHITEDKIDKLSDEMSDTDTIPVRSERPDVSQVTCPLCKESVSERAENRLVALINEASIQLKQSKLLQEARQDRFELAEQALAKSRKSWEEAATEYRSVTALPTTNAQKQIREMFRKLGYIEREIADADRQLKMAQRVDELADKKADLAKSIQEFKDRLEALLARQAKRTQQAHNMVEANVIELLKNDLERQDSFQNPKMVNFSFAGNRITVDDATYFSASSTAYLRSAFLIGLFAASLKDPQFRHPRLILLDSLEDKGMEPERVHNLQDLIVGISEEARPAHQVIFATSIPSPKLDPKMQVGHFSTRENGTLNIS
ncbi:hypothetical protein N9W89_08535 [Hellea sp.]|nr:hypothetical protein [Hellea sp.]